MQRQAALDSRAYSDKQCPFHSVTLNSKQRDVDLYQAFLYVGDSSDHWRKGISVVSDAV